MKVKLGKWNKRDHRKIDVEIENHDTWSLDHSLALIILPALIQLKDTKHGVPSEFGDVGGAEYEQQLSFDFYKETNNWAFEESCKKWDEVLDKMIWSFQQLAIVDYDHLYHHGKAEYDWVKDDTMYKNPVTGKLEHTYKMLDKNPNDHYYDYVGNQLHEARVQEGLDLFAKYYRGLWD